MASNPTSDVKEHRWVTRERPWLVPWNRKLRHLKGLVLRNLDLSGSHDRPRRKTIDDDALPNSLKSPAKLLALREVRTLEHSRSSADLRPIDESAISDKISKADNGMPKSPNGKLRPSMAKLRRRSTMEWAASPHLRQKKLEDVSARRMADMFFAIHVEGVEEAVYVSEIIEKTMDPDFRHIELDGCGPGITRAESLTVRFWTKREKTGGWSPFLDISLSLRSLQFIGRDLAAFSHPFPHNSVIFELTDGYYTCFTDAQVDEAQNPFASNTTKASPSRSLPTSSFDSLLRLSKLDDSIQDALALRDKLSRDLERVVESNRDTLAQTSLEAETTDFVKTVEYAKATVEKRLRNLSKNKEQKQASLDDRRKLLQQGQQEQISGREEVSSGQLKLDEDRTGREEVRNHTTQQRRRICEDIQRVYPITPVPDKPLSFTIRGLRLPDSEDLESVPTDEVAAALGHVAHVVQLLSFYLAQPLPYPVHPRSSSSTITDPVSIMKPGVAAATQKVPTNSHTDPSRVFPLYSRGGPRFRFEYGLFLLNKDIELLLANAFRVRVLDIRQTLPNLLHALYCATAGEGELPARKAGGVRGLLRAGRGGGASMPETKRTPSTDSNAPSWLSGTTLGRGKENGRLDNGGGAYGSLTGNQEDQDRRMHAR